MSVIRFEHVTVQYPVYASPTTQFRHSLVSFATGGRIFQDSRKVSYVEALNDISLELKDSDRLAVLGHNGAGKTTFLKTLAGFLPLHSGAMTVDGQVTVLFNLANGLDLEKTGYENIKGMGMLMGMSKANIAAITPEVEQFCELGEFLNLPVRMYSDGMKVRLAFAISTSIEPDILVLDEAIGAGDAHFIKKAEARAHALYDKARLLVIATHSPQMARSLCNKGLLLEKGKIKYFGDIDTALRTYLPEAE